MDPDDPAKIYMHHPLTHRVGDSGFYRGAPPTGTNAYVYNVAENIQSWYNQKTADILKEFKTATDSFGGSLLDHTIIPYVTEVGDPSHTRSSKGGLIFGGAKLGMKGGQFLNQTRPQTDLFLTIAQAYFRSTTPLTNLNSEAFATNGVGVIEGMWAPRG